METVRNLNENTVDALRDLIEVNMDSYKGFQSAAESVSDAQLAQLFRNIGKMRKQHADGLRGYVATDGEEQGSTTGQLHRWWLEARAALQSGDAHAVLSEAERGEDHIKKAYEDLLREIAGNPLSEELHRQYAEVKHHHDEIRALRDSYAS